jgi:hypothetical protein
LFRGRPTHVDESTEAAAGPATTVPIPFEDNVQLASYTGTRGPTKRKSKKRCTDDDKYDPCDYYVVDPDMFDAVLKRGREKIDLFSYIGRSFEDVEEPGEDAESNAFTYGKVVGVYTCDQYDGYFFKYYNPQTSTTRPMEIMLQKYQRHNIPLE